MVARSSPEGAEQFNRDLSRMRAEAVLTHLQNTFQDPDLQQQLRNEPARIANELNHQYTLAFSMAHPPDDKFHSLRVRVRRPQHRVRARRGYIATTDRKTF